MSTSSDLDAADPDRLTPPPADETDETLAVRRTLRTVVVATVAAMVVIAVIVWATAPLRQAHSLYATQTRPLAVADAKDFAAKAKADAARAQAAADRARAAAAAKTAQP